MSTLLGWYIQLTKSCRNTHKILAKSCNKSTKQPAKCCKTLPIYSSNPLSRIPTEVEIKEALILHQNKSAWLPVPVKSSVSSVSFCSHSISQSPLRWHSHVPSWLPESLCGRYSFGNAPSASSKRIAVFRSSILYPRLRHRSTSRRKVLVIRMVYILKCLKTGTCRSTSRRSPHDQHGCLPARVGSCPCRRGAL